MSENQQTLSLLIGMNRDVRVSIIEKNEIYSLVEEITTLSVKARREGLLAIEKTSTDHILLKKGFELIISGTDPILVEQIMGTLIVSGDYRGKELVLRLIMMDGVIAIQKGVNPDRLHDVLISWLGEDFEIPSDHNITNEELLQQMEQIHARMKNA